jgi:hypothetical protein
MQLALYLTATENTGKSLLVKALRLLLLRNKKEYKKTLGGKVLPSFSTHGLSHNWEKIPHPKKNHQSLTVNFFDFGGQEIFCTFYVCLNSHVQYPRTPSSSPSGVSTSFASTSILSWTTPGRLWLNRADVQNWVLVEDH